MAYMTEFMCIRCGNSFHDAAEELPSPTCPWCRFELKKHVKEQFLKDRAALSVEQRLETIESLIFDLDLTNRLRILEAKCHRYA